MKAIDKKGTTFRLEYNRVTKKNVEDYIQSLKDAGFDGSLDSHGNTLFFQHNTKNPISGNSIITVDYNIIDGECSIGVDIPRSSSDD